MKINNTKLTKNLKSDYFSKNAYYIDDTLYFSNGHFIITASAGTIENLKTGFDNDTKTARLLKDSYSNMCECFKDSCARCCVNLQDLKAVKAAGRNDFLIPTSNNKFATFSTNYLLDFFEMLKIKSDHIVNISKDGKMLAIFYEGVTVVLLGVNLPKEKQNNNSYFLDFCTDKENGYKLLEEKEKEKQEAKQEAKTSEAITEIKENETISGFYAYLSGREYFLKTDNKRVTKKVIEQFIKVVGIVKGKNADTINKMATIKENVDYTKNRIYKATLKKNTIGNYTFIDIDGDSFSCGGNIDELKTKLYIFDFDALTPIRFYQENEETAATDTDNTTTTETTNDNRQTETETVPTTPTTTTETTTTATTIKTADKPKKTISLFVAVTSQELQPLKFDNLPKIEKYPTYASYFYNAIVKPVKVNATTGASVGSRAGVQGLGTKAETITSGFIQPFNTS